MTSTLSLRATRVRVRRRSSFSLDHERQGVCHLCSSADRCRSSCTAAFPLDFFDVTLEEGPPQQSLLTPEAIASFKEWKSKEFPARLKAARFRGEAAAKHHIKARQFRLRECGKPAGTRGIDSATGYELEWVGPCEHLDYLYLTEARAYNRTMLDWHEKHPNSHK